MNTATFHLYTQRAQSVMAAASRTESIGVIYEISLINRLQYPDEPRLHQLVLQRRDTQRPLLRASRLRDVHPLRTGCGMYAILCSRSTRPVSLASRSFPYSSLVTLSMPEAASFLSLSKHPLRSSLSIR